MRYALFRRSLCVLLFFTACVDRACPQSLLLDTRDGVELWSHSQASPGFGLSATIIELRAPDEAHISTIHGLRIRGEVHQTWLSGPFGTGGTSDPSGLASLGDNWQTFDTHLLFEPWQFFRWVDETNDDSTTELIGRHLGATDAGFYASTGWGDLGVKQDEDWGSLATRSDRLNLAYVVGCDVTFQVGVIGPGIASTSGHLGTLFGYQGNPPLQILSSDTACPVPETNVNLMTLCGIMFFTCRRQNKRIHQSCDWCAN